MNSERKIEVGGCLHPGESGIDPKELEDIAANSSNLVPGDKGVIFCKFFDPWDRELAERYKEGGLPVKFVWDGEGPVCEEKTCRYNERARDLFDGVARLPTKES